ncbi:CFI-box-CTERM domain-containing protein [Risungbinella massiliensis]|uniref:CFI-box-CTERM domain-containing protein n=1 Tax=Risungbinella massiliensis TaxID=1329796 RepID=UPI00069ABBE7|nr:CFI-box-CTERM domain-containing protein [Risungbinella massiliensis]
MAKRSKREKAWRDDPGGYDIERGSTIEHYDRDGNLIGKSKQRGGRNSEEWDRFDDKGKRVERKYNRESKSGGGCYLTTACVEYQGLPDNCYELETLRRYRDNYLLSTSEGQKEVESYYQISPTMVDRIKQRSNQADIYQKIYQELVSPTVRLIESGQNEEAYRHYKRYVESLNNELSPVRVSKNEE